MSDDRNKEILSAEEPNATYERWKNEIGEDRFRRLKAHIARLEASPQFQEMRQKLREQIADAIPQIQEGQRQADSELESWGLPKVEGDIEKLYELARLTGRNADPMTYGEVVDWAVELKRESTIRRQVQILLEDDRNKACVSPETHANTDESKIAIETLANDDVESLERLSLQQLPTVSKGALEKVAIRKLKRLGNQLVREFGNKSDLRAFAYQNSKRFPRDFWLSVSDIPSNKSAIAGGSKVRLNSETTRWLMYKSENRWRELIKEFDSCIVGMPAMFFERLGFDRLPEHWLDFLVEYGLSEQGMFRLPRLYDPLHPI